MTQTLLSSQSSELETHFSQPTYMEQIIMEMHKSVDNGVDIWRLGSDFILSRNETPNLAQHRVRSDGNISVLGEIVLVLDVDINSKD